MRKLRIIAKILLAWALVLSLLGFPKPLWAQNGYLNIYAGTGKPGSLDGALIKAELNSPYGLAVDNQGSLYLADSYNNSIRVIANGTVSTVAGSVSSPDAFGFPKGGYGDGDVAVAKFNRPRAVAVDSQNNIFVADTQNHVIRKIAGGKVTTLAGTGKAGYKNGPAQEAQFNTPCGLALDRSGNLYVADTMNNVIRKIAPSGEVSTFAGSSAGTAGYQDGSYGTAFFNEPAALAIDIQDNLYIADTGNQVIRKANGGRVDTLAGSHVALIPDTAYYQGGFLDGSSQAAAFNFPKGLTILENGTVIVADSWNYRVRAILTSGEVITLAGTGKSGKTAGPLSSAELGSPVGVAASGNNLYIADADNNLIWQMAINPSSLQGRLNFDPPAEQIQVWVNGTRLKVTADSQPYLSNGRTMLPLRAICESMGWTVEWAQDGNINVINGNSRKTFASTDANLQNKNGRTMMGLRYLAESMSCTVEWIPDYRAVTVRER